MTLLSTSGLGSYAEMSELTDTRLGSRLATMVIAPQNPPLPVCQNCVGGTYIHKQDKRFEESCWLMDSEKPYRMYEWSCRRFSCDSGKFYYQRSSDTPAGCFDHKYVAACPSDSCSPQE